MLTKQRRYKILLKQGSNKQKNALANVGTHCVCKQCVHNWSLECLNWNEINKNCKENGVLAVSVYNLNVQ